jgi:magnesium-transporting ATPase (P-type)
MLMSVVARIGAHHYVFMKGAPERFANDDVCTSYSGPSAFDYDKYQAQGLRSLCVSVRQLDDWDPNMARDPLERGHRLLGSLGIEDSLQHDAGLTVDLLTTSGIKIWVATGDARKNTLVTATHLKLVQRVEKTVHLTEERLARFKEFSDEVLELPEMKCKFSILVDCNNSSLVHCALDSPQFIQSLYRARCVVFYRCRPSIKADIVVALQNAGKRVLGIGDGANDSDLLDVADVGIGLLGQNGHQSFANCHFAIPLFGHLSHIILVHGHTSLHRSTIAINFSFYKAVLFAVCQIIYQIWTDCSAQPFFDLVSRLMYNYVWTLIPVGAVVFEKDIGDSFLYKLNNLYQSLRGKLSLSVTNFQWFISAVLQGSIAMSVGYALTGEAFHDDNGRDLGQPYLALVIYLALFLICEFEIVLLMNTFTYYSLALVFGNILLRIGFSIIFQTYPETIGISWYGFFANCLSSFRGIALLLTIVLAAITPAWVGVAVWNEYWAADSMMAIEQEAIAAQEDRPLFFERAPELDEQPGR